MKRGWVEQWAWREANAWPAWRARRRLHRLTACELGITFQELRAAGFEPEAGRDAWVHRAVTK